MTGGLREACRPLYRGITRSRPFEAWLGDLVAREDRPATPEEIAACALMTGLENLSASAI